LSSRRVAAKDRHLKKGGLFVLELFSDYMKTSISWNGNLHLFICSKRYAKSAEAVEFLSTEMSTMPSILLCQNIGALG